MGLSRRCCTWATCVVVGAMIFGIALRLIWPADIEYKGDEHWTFEQASALVAGAPWPLVGMKASIGLPNPGLSLWVFAGIVYVSGAQTPPELAQVVQFLNVLALLAFVSFACVCVSIEARERWLWAGALWAVNPMAIIFERKIWPPSVLPLASVALIACWWFRRNLVASFLCGLMCALMAQMHLGVIFLTAALFAWTWLYDRSTFRWGSWIAGGAVGAPPALPWLLGLLQQSGEAALRWRYPKPNFFFRWVSQPFGFGIEYTLGPEHFRDYLSSPWIAGLPTYAMAFAHAVLIALCVVVAARAVSASFAAPWPGTRKILIGDDPEAVLVNAFFWGYGGLLTLITLIGPGSERHYLIVAAPVMAIWCVRMVWVHQQNRGRTWSRLILASLCVVQALTSAGLLAYIHRTQIIQNEYGPTWRSQQPGFVRPGSS